MTWALVTGAAQGLGAEICRTLAAKGHNVVVHYRAQHALAMQVVEECRNRNVKAEVIQGDFSTPAGTADFLQRYLAQFSETDILINNVGEYKRASPLEMPMNEWQEIFQSNFFTPVALTQSLIASLKKYQGSIVNIGIAGVQGVPRPFSSTAYRMTKLSLWGYTRSLAAEMAPSQVRVNMVSPGHLSNSVDLPPTERLPMGRPASLAEAAQAVYFFVDPANRYITGQNLEIAGACALI
jgi:NAD(P)-dependent dehydrogenase (short-subunit alcohol dehydrogenase family)